MHRVTPFDPQAATPQQRLAIGELLTLCHSVSRPEDPPLVPQREADGLLQTQPEHEQLYWAVWDGEAAIACACLSYSTTENLHAASAWLQVHPQRRRRGLGREVAKVVQARAQASGRRLITFSTFSRLPAAAAFAQSLGAVAAQENRISQLVLAEVDQKLMQQWTQRPAGEPYQLHIWPTQIPSEYLERYADLLTFLNDAPKGDVELDDFKITPEMVRAWEKNMAELGEQVFTLTVEDTRSGELVGLTETAWTPERATLIDQMATVVRPSARGQGLGKWLKAAMFLHLQGKTPGAQYLRTGNAEENAAMLGINIKMGFKPWASTTRWKLEDKPHVI